MKEGFFGGFSSDCSKPILAPAGAEGQVSELPKKAERIADGAPFLLELFFEAGKEKRTGVQGPKPRDFDVHETIKRIP
jgi:hypothetical protein